jgi:carbonic anhydrase
VSNIHFHLPSEHVINGKRFDVEFHIAYSVAKDTGVEDNKVLDGAEVSIFFSENEYDQDINFLQNDTIVAFFDDLKLDD